MSLFGGLSLPFFLLFVLFPFATFSLYKIPQQLIIFRKNVEFIPKTTVGFFAHFFLLTGFRFFFNLFMSFLCGLYVYLYSCLFSYFAFIFFVQKESDGRDKLDLTLAYFVFVCTVQSFYQ